MLIDIVEVEELLLGEGLRRNDLQVVRIANDDLVVRLRKLVDVVVSLY